MSYGSLYEQSGGVSVTLGQIDRLVSDYMASEAAGTARVEPQV